MTWDQGTPIALKSDWDGDDDVLDQTDNNHALEILSIISVLGTASVLKQQQATLSAALQKFLDQAEVKSGSGLVGHASGFTARNGADADHELDISLDEIVLKRTTGGRITLEGKSATIDIENAGANGLDAGTVAALTGYYIWAIWNGTTFAGLFSLSATSPTMPSGYAHRALIGWVRTDTSANIVPIVQHGRRVDYQTARRVTQGDTSSLWSTVNLSGGGFVPTMAKRVHGMIMVNNGSGQAGVANRGDLSTTLGAGRPEADIVVAQNFNLNYYDFLLLNSNLYFISNQGNAELTLLGFEF